MVLGHGKTLVGGPIRCMVASADGQTRRFSTVQPGASPIASAARAVRALLSETVDLGALQGCALGVPLPMVGDPVTGSDRRTAKVIPSLAHLVGSQPQVEALHLAGGHHLGRKRHRSGRAGRGLLWGGGEALPTSPSFESSPGSAWGSRMGEPARKSPRGGWRDRPYPRRPARPGDVHLRLTRLLVHDDQGWSEPGVARQRPGSHVSLDGGAVGGRREARPRRRTSGPTAPAAASVRPWARSTP